MNTNTPRYRTRSVGTLVPYGSSRLPSHMIRVAKSPPLFVAFSPVPVKMGSPLADVLRQISLTQVNAAVNRAGITPSCLPSARLAGRASGGVRLL